MSKLSGAPVPPINKDPSKLPRFTAVNSNLRIISASTATAWTLQQSGAAAAFWDAYENGGGAWISQAAAAEVWNEICDISGSGFLMGLLSHTTASTDGEATFRIAIDGVVTEITLPISTSRRGGVGIPLSSEPDLPYFIKPISAFNTTNTDSLISNPYIKSSTYQNIVLPSAFNALGQNFPSARFDVGLKVEIKSSVAITTSNQAKNAVVQYVLD